jgi:hypothetical protein
MNKNEVFFVWLIITTIMMLFMSLLALAYFIINIIRNSVNILIWLEEPMRFIRGGVVTRFVIVAFYIFLGFLIDLIMIRYCIDEYKKL